MGRIDDRGKGRSTTACGSIVSLRAEGFPFIGIIGPLAVQKGVACPSLSAAASVLDMC